jgi:peptide/nickel transport system permease protein
VALPLDRPADIAASPEGGEGRATGSIWRLIFDVFIKNRLAVVGLLIIVFMAMFSFVGPFFYHTDQVHTQINRINLRPSPAHLLGTDNLGYDVLGRLMLGGQSSLEVGLAAALLASIVGTAWGAVSGFVGGWIDAIMMRVVDSLLAIPYLIFVLLLASIFTPSIPMLIIVIAMVSWLFTARLVRGDTLSLRIRDYVVAATAVGTRNWRIVTRHIIPNVMGTVVVAATFSVADSILLLAALSYLGLGPPPPAANWGGMLTNGLSYVYDGDWWLIYPAGIAIVLTVVAFNFIGDALRDSLEVRLQER